MEDKKRIIDFWFFTKSDKQFRKIGEFRFTGRRNSKSFFPESDDVVVLQYTGVMDSEGNRIFDGHLITNGNSKTIYRVYWDTEKSGWSAISKDGDNYGPYYLIIGRNRPLKIVGHSLVDNY